MQNAAPLPLLLSQTKLPVSIAALFVGAALATGSFAIADDDGLGGAPPAKAIVVDQPAGGAVNNEAAADQAEPSRPAGPRGLASGLSGR